MFPRFLGGNFPILWFPVPPANQNQTDNVSLICLMVRKREHCLWEILPKPSRRTSQKPHTKLYLSPNRATPISGLDIVYTTKNTNLIVGDKGLFAHALQMLTLEQ